jgi:hypothetical protein
MVWDQDFHKKNNQATLHLEDIPLPIIYIFDNKICLNQVQGKVVKVITSDHRPNTCEFMPWYPPQILKFPDTSTNTRNFPYISSSPIKCSSHEIVTKIPPISTNQTITSHLKSLNKHKNTININKPNNHLSSQIIEQTQKYHQYQQTKKSPLITNHLNNTTSNIKVSRHLYKY